MTFNKKFKIALILGILVVVAVAYLDLRFANSGVFGNYDDYTNGNYTSGLWELFKLNVLILFSIVPICYYFFVKKDRSESLAIFTTSHVLWSFGMSDLLYFWLQGKMIPQTLPWLDKNTIIGGVAHLLRFEGVTAFTLLFSVTLGFIVVVLTTKFLEQLN